MVKYWGAEWGKRQLYIYIDDDKLITEDNTGRWNISMFLFGQENGNCYLDDFKLKNVPLPQSKDAALTYKVHGFLGVL